MLSPPSSTSSSWQDACDRAQSSFNALRSSAQDPSSSIRPAVVRVSQIDSELLDQELVHILREPLNKAIALVKPSLRSRFTPELTLLIEAILYRGSIWNLGASYGARLQGLHYSAQNGTYWGGSYSPSGLPRKLLFIHGALTVLVPYLHTRLRTYALSGAWPDAPASDKRRKAWDLLTNVETTYAALGLLNFVAFLWDGRYRTLVDRLLNMRLVLSSNSVNRNVSYEFMNRQMVWHAFTEFLVFILPLIYPKPFRRLLQRVLSSIKISFTPHKSQSVVGKKRGPYWLLPTDQCAICAESASYSLSPSNPSNAFNSISSSILRTQNPTDEGTSNAAEPPQFPIYTPYVASCGDVYCYHCLAERFLRAADDDADDGGFWKCLRCGEPVREAERVGAEENGSFTYSASERSSDE